MAFHNVPFPVAISYGSSGRVSFDTRIIRVASGYDEIKQRSANEVNLYNAREAIQAWSDLMEVKTHFLNRGGATNTFPFKDEGDFTTAADGISAHAIDDGTIGVGDGVETDFQLVKIYDDGSYQHSRKILLPVSGTVLVEEDGVAQTEGVDFTVSYTTGIVTFTTAPADTLVIKAGCEFNVHVRYGDEAEAILDTTHVAFQSGNIPDIPLIEIPDLDPLPPLFYPGGYKDHGTVSSGITIEINPADGLLHEIDATSTGIKLKLMNAVEQPGGGPYFAFSNTGSETVTIVNQDDVTVTTVSASGGAEVWMGANATWYGW